MTTESCRLAIVAVHKAYCRLMEVPYDLNWQSVARDRAAKDCGRLSRLYYSGGKGLFYDLPGCPSVELRSSSKLGFYLVRHLMSRQKFLQFQGIAIEEFEAVGLKLHKMLS